MEIEPNPYKRQHRFFKAVKIVDRIEELSLKSFVVKNMDVKGRARLAAEAGFPSPSVETWDLVIDLFLKRVVDPLVRKAEAPNSGNGHTLQPSS